MVSILADLIRAEQGADVGRKLAEQGKTLNWGYLIRKMSDEGVLFLFFITSTAFVSGIAFRRVFLTCCRHSISQI
ncbi:MAG: hypothetical protein ACYDAA_14885 [Syntrophales bacterium]